MLAQHTWLWQANMSNCCAWPNTPKQMPWKPFQTPAKCHGDPFRRQSKCHGSPSDPKTGANDAALSKLDTSSVPHTATHCGTPTLHSMPRPQGPAGAAAPAAWAAVIVACGFRATIPMFLTLRQTVEKLPLRSMPRPQGAAGATAPATRVPVIVACDFDATVPMFPTLRETAEKFQSALCHGRMVLPAPQRRPLGFR